MRIFRTIILLTGIAVLLPSPPEQPGAAVAATEAGSDAPGLVATAAQTVYDVASFCSRQPGVCDTAGYLAGKMEAKAKYSVRLLYEWANESVSDPAVPTSIEDIAADPMNTGSSPALRLKTVADGQSTLKLEDLIPEWRGPVKPRKG
jgi:Family of unknown function (DUF5330)